MFFPWLKKRQRQKLLSEPFPAAWLGYLARNVRHYPFLKPSEQAKMRAVVSVFAAEKRWEGGRDFVVTEEMKVTVAGQAAVLVLGLDEPYFFDRVQSIILYPATFVHPSGFSDRFLLEGVPLMGEIWQRSPIILSWQDVLQSGRNANQGRNVVFHEFAHHLDILDGEMDGTPPLARGQMKNWCRVTEAEYLRLVGNARRDEVTLLDHYGASNRTEFFAVAVECFFEQPRALQRQHPELYGVLRDFFRQDPAPWLPDADLAPPPETPRRKAKKNRRRKTTESAASDLGCADEQFTHAVAYINEGRYDLAEQSASEALRLNPADDEAYSLRALARVNLGQFPSALEDCNQALRLDPDSLDAHQTRAAACIGLQQYDQAKADLKCVFNQSHENAETYYLRGLTWSGLGKSKRAVSDFSLSLAKNPFAADAYYHRSKAYQQLGRTQEAEEDMKKAFQLDPQADRPPWQRRHVQSP